MPLSVSTRDALEAIIVGVPPVRTLAAVLSLAERFEDGLAATEERVYDEVILRLARTARVEVRTRLSDRLAGLGTGPVRTVSDLALDLDAAVADPVLRRSVLVSERDLITVAFSRSDDHLAAIAERPGVHGPVVEGIVARGSQRVLRLLSANPTARLPRNATARLAASPVADDRVTVRPSQPSAIPRTGRSSRRAENPAIGFDRDPSFGAVTLRFGQPAAEDGRSIPVARDLGPSREPAECALRPIREPERSGPIERARTDNDAARIETRSRMPKPVFGRHRSGGTRRMRDRPRRGWDSQRGDG